MSFSIPTAARGSVRAYVKSLAGFDAFAASLGIPSREVKNADLLVFAEQSGKLDEVKALIARATGVHPGPFATERFNDAIADAVAAVEHDGPTQDEKREAARHYGMGLDEMQGLIDAFNPDKNKAVFDMAGLLADVDQFLSPVVKRELERALAPVVAAANKPAVVTTVEVEKIVTVEAALKAPIGAVPYAVKTGGKIPFAKLFSVNTTLAFGKSPISLWDSSGYAPSIDPYYVVDALNMALLATAAEHETNVWLFGPSGSGKTSMPHQFCAYTGRPFVRINFTRQTEVADLIGGNSLVEGEHAGSMVSKWQDGSLIAAMRRPGTVILLDEPTIAPAGVQAVIQAVTDDHRMYTIHATGEVVRCAPGVVFVVADNTNGSGDETGQYAGTNQANAALINRFKRMVRVDYMSKKQETAALVNHTNIAWDAAEHVTDFMARARKLPAMEGVVLSLRQMVGFVNTVKDGFNAKSAFDVAVLSRLPNAERAALETLATLQWSEQFENLLHGVTPTVESPDPVAPADSAASRAFDDDVTASLNR